MGRSKDGSPAAPPRRRSNKRDRPRVCSIWGLLAAKVVLCAMNVASFALAAGLVAVGTKKARGVGLPGAARGGRSVAGVSARRLRAAGALQCGRGRRGRRSQRQARR
jgi:hypothetical protein